MEKHKTPNDDDAILCGSHGCGVLVSPHSPRKKDATDRKLRYEDCGPPALLLLILLLLLLISLVCERASELGLLLAKGVGAATALPRREITTMFVNGISQKKSLGLALE